MNNLLDTTVGVNKLVEAETKPAVEVLYKGMGDPETEQGQNPHPPQTTRRSKKQTTQTPKTNNINSKKHHTHTHTHTPTTTNHTHTQTNNKKTHTHTKKQRQKNTTLASPTREVVVLVRAGQRVGAQLLQQKRVLEDSLDGFDHVGLQRGRVLLLRVPGQQELAEGLVGVCTPCSQLYSAVQY